MKLENLKSDYYKYQISEHRHSFSKPTPEKLYVKILKFINDRGPYVQSAIVRRHFPTAQLYPHMLCVKGYIKHYREGRNTYWKLTSKGSTMLTKAYDSTH